MKLHKGKRLLIDEIDASIHSSRLKEFWKIILQQAQKYNIQLFASTHNWECLDYFTQALEELAEQGQDLIEKARVITLRTYENGKNMAFTDTFDQFSHLIEVGMDMRGAKL